MYTSQMSLCVIWKQLIQWILIIFRDGIEH